MRFGLRHGGALGLLVALWGCASLATRAPGPDAPSLVERVDEARDLARRGQAEAARSLLESLLQRAPRSVAVHRALQNLRMAAHEREELTRTYRDLRDRAPRDPLWRYLHGRLLHRVDDQRAEFQRARDLAPDWVWGVYGLAWAELAEGHAERALRFIDIALDLDPHHALAHQLKGRALASLQEFDLAEVELRHAAGLDPLSSSQAWIALAGIEAARGARLGEFEALSSALDAAPADEGIVERLLGWLEDSDSRALRLLARDRLEAYVADWPDVPPVRRVRARLGRGRHELREELVRLEAVVESGVVTPDISHQLRRLVARRNRRACALWVRALGVSVAELAPGPARIAECLDPSREAPPLSLADWLRRLDRAGWQEEALDVVRSLPPAAVDEEAKDVIRTLRSHLRAISKLELFASEVEAGLHPRAASDLGAYVRTMGRIVARETGEKLGDGEPLRSFPFVGEILDSSCRPPGSLNAYLGRHGQVMFAGRLAGGTSQALLMNIVQGPLEEHPQGWPDDRGVRGWIGEAVRIRPKEDLFGESAGRALLRSYYLDLDILRPWAGRLERDVRALSEEQKRRLEATTGLEAHGSRERQDLALPLDAAMALRWRSFRLHGRLPLVENVHAHEIGHLFDALEFLPLGDHILSNLLLALQGGFSAEGIMSYLEESAEAHALAHGPSPHLVLAEMVSALPRTADAGPHSRGYRRLLGRFVAELDRRLDEFPSIRKDRTLLHQLHRLSEAEIRDLASALN